MKEMIAKEVVMPTRQQVRDALAVRIWADLQRLNTVLGMGAMHTLLGLADSIDTRHTTLKALELADLDIEKFELGRLALALYDFAADGWLARGLDLQNFYDAFAHYEDFVVSLDSELLALFQKNLRWAADVDPDQVLKTLYKAAKARFELERGTTWGDEHGWLDLEGVALLAGMQLPSVRNATNAEGEDALQLYSTNTVTAQEARRWLQHRRNFKPTVIPPMGDATEMQPAPLHSLYELGHFMENRWHMLGKHDQHDLLQELGWPPARLAYLQGLWTAPHTLDLRDCPSLSRSLQVHEAWFTTQVMQLMYPQQLAQVQYSLAASGLETPAPAASARTLERLCLRLVFELRDGEKLYPVRMKNRETGAVMFRLSEGGAGGNTKERSIEVDSEDTMIELVVHKKMAVRMNSLAGTRAGLYRPDGYAVSRVELDGKAVQWRASRHWEER